MSLFKFRILDVHEYQSFNDDGDLMIKPKLEDGWQSFHLVIDVSEVKITSFRSYVLFDHNDNPTEVTKVFLSDGSYVFAANKLDTFTENYKSDYLSLFVST